MDLIKNIDQHVVLKCYKEKRGERTFVIGLYDFFDSIEECNNFCKKLQRILATSMKIIENSNNLDNDNDNEEICDKHSNDSDNKEKSKKNKKKDKKKENKKKEIVYVDPIYTFRGNQIDEIKKYILKNTTIDENLIKL